MVPRLALAAVLCIGCAQGALEDSDAGTDAAVDAGPRCGDGVRQNAEECDLGDRNGPNAGCERDCTWSCLPNDATRGDAHCDPHDPCKGVGGCGDDHVCRVSGALPTGASCGGAKICRDGACLDPVCGDGIVTAPEECDDGKNDGSGGCGPGCRFTCISSDQVRNCAPSDPCQGASTCNDSTHTCSPRTPLSDGVSCGAARICRSGVCVANTCGNGVVDPGEQCDPPNGTTCDSSCQAIAGQVCGNGIREGAEQCDDGNTLNLDGCDSNCRFEQDQRLNSMAMQYGTDAFCAANALGGAIGSAAQSTLKTEIDSGIASGALTSAFRFLGLQDLSGTNASFKLGAVTGVPAQAAAGQTYSGANDPDWWYTTKLADLDAQRVPLAQLDAAISAKVLSAGPGKMSLSFIIGGAVVKLGASGVRLRASVGTVSKLAVSLGGTPGHVSTEHLDPALTSFATLVNGELCGNVSADSLANAPAPQSLQTGGSNACDEGYGASNTMLDILVQGCSTFYGFVSVIAPTQPDQVDPSVPAAGAGGPYRLSASGGRVGRCVDKRGTAVDLATCLRSAAYSSFVTFAADRVILK